MKLKQAAPAKFSTRRYNRCKICGRPHAYLRDYGICRICFRELALQGPDPGREESQLVIANCSVKRLKFNKKIEFQALADLPRQRIFAIIDQLARPTNFVKDSERPRSIMY